MAEDFNKLRLSVKKLVRTPFKHSWEFRLEIAGQPIDFDLYVKDITYGPTEIETDPVKIGGRILTFPTSAQPVTLSMTVRESKDGKMGKFFDNWAGGVINSNGTVNLPGSYVRKIKRYAIKADGTEALMDTWFMYPQQRGDVTESREEGGFLEFPMTFIQFRS